MQEDPKRPSAEGIILDDEKNLRRKYRWYRFKWYARVIAFYLFIATVGFLLLMWIKALSN